MMGDDKLYINDIPISQISGPVLSYYMTPSDESFDTFKRFGIDLPLLLLFGDIHGSEFGMCEPCDNSEGCYRIYDRELIELVDSLSSEEFPIDFYIETGESMIKTMQEHKYITFDRPLQKIVETYEICFGRNHLEEKEYTQKCGRNIKWHYSDVRMRETHIEGSIYSLAKYIKKLIKDKSIEPPNIVNLTDIKKLLDSSNTVDEFCINFFKLTPAKSLVVKQYSKTQPFIIKDIEEIWKNILFTLIIQKCNKEEDFNIQYARFDSLNELKHMENKNLNNIYHLLNAIYNSFIELYTILRILKGYKQPSLALAYLGLRHIENIVMIFENVFDYEIKLVEPQNAQFFRNQNILDIQTYIDTATRCINFIGGVHDSIDLKKDVELHNIRRIGQ